jgi:predicted nuclease of predicted toxin-antitoxin system
VARLFADENLPFPVVEALRRIGHDVVSVAHAGKAGQSLTDQAILELATADRRAVVTLNRRHFVQLHETEPSHAGIVVCSLDPDFEGQAARIDQAVAAHGSLASRLIRVNRPR